MPFLDHLEELRWRILYSLLAVVVGTLVGWVIVEHVDVIGLLIQPIKPLIPGGKLRVTSPTDPFFITLKFAFVVGLVLASPVVGYQAWAFLVPALYERERRLIIPALSAGAVLFVAGASAAYLWVLPRALGVLLSFQQNVFDPLITADKYFAFAAQLIIAFGVVTERSRSGRPPCRRAARRGGPACTAPREPAANWERSSRPADTPRPPSPRSPPRTFHPRRTARRAPARGSGTRARTPETRVAPSRGCPGGTAAA